MADGGALGTGAPVLARPKRAYGRSLADFQPLLPAEAKLLDCAARGKECDIARLRPDEAAPENTVRGPFLRFLLLGGDEDAPIHEKGVILYGAYVEGGIDLESARDVRSLWFWRCHIGQPINGSNASFDAITLQECLLGSLNLGAASISGDVFLSQSQIAGEVRFAGAEIGGQLGYAGAKLKNAGGMALSCDSAKVAGNVFLSEGFEAEGEVCFAGAEIGGQLSCDGAKLKNAGGMALVCDCAKVSGIVFLSDGFEAEGGRAFAAG